MAVLGTERLEFKNHHSTESSLGIHQIEPSKIAAQGQLNSVPDWNKDNQPPLNEPNGGKGESSQKKISPFTNNVYIQHQAFNQKLLGMLKRNEKVENNGKNVIIN